MLGECSLVAVIVGSILGLLLLVIIVILIYILRTKNNYPVRKVHPAEESPNKGLSSSDSSMPPEHTTLGQDNSKTPNDDRSSSPDFKYV